MFPSFIFLVSHVCHRNDRVDAAVLPSSCISALVLYLWQICLPLWRDPEGWPLASILLGFSAFSVFSFLHYLSSLLPLMYLFLSLFFSTLRVWKLHVFSRFSEVVILKCPCAGAPFQRAVQTPSQHCSEHWSVTLLLPASAPICAVITQCPSLLFHCHFSCETTFLLLEIHSLEFSCSVWKCMYFTLVPERYFCLVWNSRWTFIFSVH